MDRYVFLEHTADAKFQAFGKTMEEAFSNAAIALTDVVINQEQVTPTSKKSITIKSETLQSLLYDFLEKVLILMDQEHFVVAKVDSITITRSNGHYLSAVLSGDLGLEKYEYKTQVKAITYNEMKIEDKPGECMVQVVVDI
ncbi:archease [Candidatus Woesearchaeota archaeon]|nr:archease [Candidatus Woesearchaeota archaeon]